MDRILKKGEGWRLGWNPYATTYKGLVGNEDWAIELSETEFKDFCRLLLQLATTMEQMAQELVSEERIAGEAESEVVWLEVEGYPQAFSLRMILQTGRCGEGNWSVTGTQNLIEAVQNFFP
ncbi:DUF1818 family protein [Dactylococcopsis salina]|uniref:DUF1818 domain-containing protein n=1 Tax=Dactylococcopsis salina (strain PCC 8305) TaxID=13035 RepID=K9YUJ5_DACS8|nr:DUF1818 family protein [Dactylococcopsis salina]AFZ50574.1 protein of unknown function (DUF1818) [Dactylococcopsis salina PCC 8305]